MFVFGRAHCHGRCSDPQIDLSQVTRSLCYKRSQHQSHVMERQEVTLVTQCYTVSTPDGEGEAMFQCIFVGFYARVLIN